MTDKSKELKASVRLINDRLHFTGTVENNDPISIDYTVPLGDDLGYTSLELLLLSFSSCLGSAVLTFLRRMGKIITVCEIHANGQRRQDHPTGFSKIVVEIELSSPNISEEEMKKVLFLAEDKYCPVWSMIKGNTEVETSFKIN